MTTIVLATPVAYRGYVVPGSLPIRCAQCGQPVWLSPSSFFFLHDSPGALVLCWGCGQQEYCQHPGEIMPLSPAQQEEIEEYRRQVDDR